jgi:hypothetical protein
MNKLNRMCKDAARKGSRHYKKPPCEWVDCEPGVLVEARDSQASRVESYGAYQTHTEGWFSTVWPLNSKVFAEKIVAGKDVFRPATIIGGYHQPEHPESGPFHVQFQDLSYGIVHQQKLKKFVRLAAHIDTPQDAGPLQDDEVAQGAKLHDDAFEAPKAAVRPKQAKPTGDVTQPPPDVRCFLCGERLGLNPAECKKVAKEKK